MNAPGADLRSRIEHEVHVADSHEFASPPQRSELHDQGGVVVSESQAIVGQDLGTYRATHEPFHLSRGNGPGLRP
jgi:hypothetical protein